MNKSGDYEITINKFHFNRKWKASIKRKELTFSTGWLEYPELQRQIKDAFGICIPEENLLILTSEDTMLNEYRIS